MPFSSYETLHAAVREEMRSPCSYIVVTGLSVLDTNSDEPGVIVAHAMDMPLAAPPPHAARRLFQAWWYFFKEDDACKRKVQSLLRPICSASDVTGYAVQHAIWKIFKIIVLKQIYFVD